MSEISGRKIETLPGLFNFYSRADRGFIFSKRMQIVAAMIDAMLAKEAELRTEKDPNDFRLHNLQR